jgi:hypothetical protein
MPRIAASTPGPTAAGYSGTPLARKLGIQASSRVLLCNAPAGFAGLLEPLPADVVFDDAAGPGIDIAQVFVTQRDELSAQLAALT